MVTVCYPGPQDSDIHLQSFSLVIKGDCHVSRWQDLNPSHRDGLAEIRKELKTLWGTQGQGSKNITKHTRNTNLFFFSLN